MIKLRFLYNNCTAFVYIWEGFGLNLFMNTNGTIGKWYNWNELHLAIINKAIKSFVEMTKQLMKL